MSPARRLRLGPSVTAAGAGLLAHGAPATLVLPTFLPRPPIALPGGLCRWRGPEDVPSVALTFDDGPSPDTHRTLDLLAEVGAPATFFLLASQMLRHRDLVTRIVAEGHEIATHGTDHRHHLVTSPWAVLEDLRLAVAVHGDLLGEPPRFYRPTYGQLSAATVVAARRLDLETVLWSGWGKEWAETAVEPVLARLEPALRPGAILLLHDTEVSCPPGTAARTHQALAPLVGQLADRGLRPVTLSGLLDPGVVGS